MDDLEDRVTTLYIYSIFLCPAMAFVLPDFDFFCRKNVARGVYVGFNKGAVFCLFVPVLCSC